MIRHLAAAALLSTTLIATAHADARDNEVIGSFKQLCAGGQPNLSEMGQKAQAMQLVGTQQATKQPSGSGGTIVSQAWNGNLAGGPIELIGSEVSDARGQLATCGVTAVDVNGAAFQRDLVAELQLGKPTGVTSMPGSSVTMTSWNGAFGPNTTLQLMQSTTPDAPGVTLTYASKAQ